MTPGAEERCLVFEELNAYWEYITGLTFDYVSTDMAIENEEVAIEELRRIKRYLNEKVLKKMEGCPPKDIPSEDDIMGTFFNILACHRILCNENDRIKINYRGVEGEPPSSEYAEKTLEYDRLLSEDIKVNIVFREEKPQYCIGKGCILIDDMQRNIRDWIAMGGTGIVHISAEETIRQLKEIDVL